MATYMYMGPKTKHVKLDDDSSECWINTTDESGDDSDTGVYTMEPHQKQKISDLPTDSGSCSKQPKRWDWSDNAVGVNKETTTETGIATIQTYEGIGKCRRSLEDIKEQINNTQCHKIWSKDYFYYTGFKKGLTTLLSQIHQDNIGYHAFLIHGIPKVGKSSLAKNLAYHLASAGNTATVVRMKNSQVESRNLVTGGLEHYIGQKTGWLIMDQVNVSSLDSVEFCQLLLGSERQTPVIMFTCGHFYPPSRSWTERPFKFSVIDMEVDVAGVTQVKKYFSNMAVQETDMLKISAVMGHICTCIRDTCYETEPVSLARLEECVYDVEGLSSQLSNHPNILWMLWPEFCGVSTEVLAKRNKPKDWILDPSKVRILGSVLGLYSDPLNVQTRLFVNWLHIDGDGRSSENQNDGFFEHKNYYFYFPFLMKLHRIIAKAYQVSPKVMFNKLLDLYELVRTNDVCAGAVEGNLFKSLITLQCQIWAAENDRPTGLMFFGRPTVSSTVVDEILTPCDVKNLCDMAEAKRTASSRKQFFWCDLNKKSNDQFKGYDFALIQVENAKYVVFQLFQATVSIATHRSGTMLSVLEEIRERCSKFAAQGKVLPYFLCPHKNSREDDELVDLDIAGNVQAQVVNMSAFVRR